MILVYYSLERLKINHPNNYVKESKSYGGGGSINSTHSIRMEERQYTCESKTKAAFNDQIINFKKQLRHYMDCHGAFTSGYYIDLIGLTKEIAAISSIDSSLSLCIISLS